MSFLGSLIGTVGKIAGAGVDLATGNVGGAVSNVASIFGGTPSDTSGSFPATPPGTNGGFSGFKLGPLAIGHSTPAPAPPASSSGNGKGGGFELPMIGRIGFAPEVIGNVNAKHGRLFPSDKRGAHTLKRCPGGFVLAIDNKCYPRSMVPRSWRKWKPRRKGPISYRDWKAVTRARSAEKRIKRVAEKAGLTTRKRKR